MIKYYFIFLFKSGNLNQTRRDADKKPHQNGRIMTDDIIIYRERLLGYHQRGTISRMVYQDS